MNGPDPVPRARDALGIRVPPVAAVRAATRARNGVERAHRSMALPFQLVLERVLGIVDTKTIACVVELRIPDLLADGPRGIDELAAEAGAEPDALRRVLRYLVSRGFFREERGARFANNGATDVLREDHPWSWRAWVEFAGSVWHAQMWEHLIDRVRDGRSAAEAAVGMSFFDYVNQLNPRAGEAFNGAMACGSRIQGLLFAEHVALDRFQRLCDVGGGTGSVLVHVLRSCPGLQGIVFDVPALSAGAQELIDASDVGGRASFVAGDFFDSVPGDCDLYTMFAVMHDWDDDTCRRILTNIGGAMRPDGRVMVVEKPLPTDDRADFARLSDMQMLVLGDEGRERTDAEYENLFAEAGFSLRRRVTLPSLFVVYQLASL